MFNKGNHKVNEMTLAERLKTLPTHALKSFLLAKGKPQICFFCTKWSEGYVISFMNPDSRILSF